MIFSWLRNRRRARLLAEPMPPEWFGYLERNVPLYARLKDAEQAKLRDDMRVLVAEKHWEGCGGLVMTDEIKVTIAAHAALLLLGITHDYFARVMSILVYPSGFRAPEGWRRGDGTIDLSAGALGEAWYDGPVILAWDSVLSGAADPKDGQNVVLHEFAHQLDYLDGYADGTPPLRKQSDYARWHDVMTREFERLKSESAHGHPLVLDRYGATNHAEFFAVATETFFEKARQMYARHPELYAVLSEYYGQDPAARPDPLAPPREEGEPAGLAESHQSVGVIPGRRPHRRSRVAAVTAAHREVSLNWPGWVRFWEIHPGVSRQQALRPLENHVMGVSVGVVMLAIILWQCHRDVRRSPLDLLWPGLMTLAMITFAVWLRLAVRWVDRHGIWGGEYRPGAEEPTGDRPVDAAQPDEPPAAPQG